MAIVIKTEKPGIGWEVLTQTNGKTIFKPF